VKREAFEHSKMKRLCRLLDLERWQGVGLLESIWNLAAKEAPRGDIGKLSDDDIALAIEYRGDETKLIEALVQARWIDRDPAERLVVHDWHEHCADSVHMQIARSQQYFAGGHIPRLVRLPVKERDAAEAFYRQGTSPSIVPDTPSLFDSQPEHTNEEQVASDSPGVVRPDVPSTENLIQETAQRIHDRHPAVRRCSVKEIKKYLTAILKPVPKGERAERLAGIERRHALRCASEQWTKNGGEYAKGLANYLAPTMGRFDEDPGPNGASQQNGGSRWDKA
jgi:hypothetical protein